MSERRTFWRFVQVALWTALVVACFMFGSRASASEPWSGSLQWRGEVVILKSCCGPIRAPVAARALDVAWNRVRADLNAVGYKHVPIPKLGTPAEPYTIVVEPPPGSCPVQADGKPARGCSRTRPGGRNTWSQSINVDRAKDRLAPTRHEPEHSLCVKLRALLRSKSIEDLYANRTICAQAGHPGPGGVRLNVLGEVPK